MRYAQKRLLQSAAFSKCWNLLSYEQKMIIWRWLKTTFSRTVDIFRRYGHKKILSKWSQKTLFFSKCWYFQSDLQVKLVEILILSSLWPKHDHKKTSFYGQKSNVLKVKITFFSLKYILRTILYIFSYSSHISI